jgi:hypothetical protein
MDFSAIMAKLDSAQILDRAYFFKDMLKFELIPGGWYPQVKKQTTATSRQKGIS